MPARATLHRGPRWPRALGAATTAALVANGVRLRRRGAALPRVVPTGLAVDPAQWRAIATPGADLDEATVAMVARWATANELDAVDVVPADLPVERALDLLRQVDPRTYRTDPLVEGRTAGHALVIREEIAKRADLPHREVVPAEMIEIARQVKRYAPRTSTIAVVPGVRATDEDLSERRAVQRAQWDRYSNLVITVPAAQLAALGVGAILAPVWGGAAMAMYLAQPVLVHGRTTNGLRPRDLATHSPRRWLDEVRRLVGTARADTPATFTERTAEELRAAYEADLAAGVERFLEPRRTTCPWCEGSRLRLKVESPDLIQHKPGTFRLDECEDCGHIFQNPRLSLDGLDFYYRDFYDGLGGGEMERIFAAEQEQYEGRIDMVDELVPDAPDRWLDVGTGHAHFCLVAQERWPDTTFEGVDMSSSIEEAADRGWVASGHRGLFPDLAPGLADRYDVVSMHHYLEHTHDPHAELDAAATALRPGGHLMIEVPDPECRWGTVLGPYWLPWFQPQHQHFVPVGNLEEALEARGFTVVERHRTRANQALDLLAGTWLALGQVVPRHGMPWQRRATWTGRAARAVVVAAALPVMVATVVVDRVLGAVPRPDGIGNTYRVLARYDNAPTGTEAEG